MKTIEIHTRDNPEALDKKGKVNPRHPFPVLYSYSPTDSEGNEYLSLFTCISVATMEHGRVIVEKD